MIDKQLAREAVTRHTDWGGVERQISLPWAQAFTISMRNVTLRLGRAAITGAGVVLGIAFLVSVWTSKVAIDGIERYNADSARAVAVSGQDAGPGAVQAEQERQATAARQNWLVIMSLLVCGVGITNSMLMSVTERFREIGTMKCLGAMDGFIVRLFLIESAVLGVLGSVLGALLGHLTMLSVYMIKEGASVAAKMNWGEMLGYVGVALLIGTILSLLAAVFPALRAAQLPPAAALATEV